MTPEDEKKLKDWLAALANGFSEMQEGVKLMTDVVIKLERRIADLELAKESKPKIIHPLDARH